MHFIPHHHHQNPITTLYFHHTSSHDESIFSYKMGKFFASISQLDHTEKFILFCILRYIDIIAIVPRSPDWSVRLVKEKLLPRTSAHSFLTFVCAHKFWWLSSSHPPYNKYNATYSKKGEFIMLSANASVCSCLSFGTSLYHTLKNDLLRPPWCGTCWCADLSIICLPARHS